MIVIVRRILALLVLLCFVGLSSGLAGYLHALEHASHEVAGNHDDAPLPHDSGNCQVHAVLGAPFVLSTPTVLPLASQDPLAEVVLAAAQLPAHGVAIRLDCRGPPIA